jgi:hypothetical protein
MSQPRQSFKLRLSGAIKMSVPFSYPMGLLINRPWL